MATYQELHTLKNDSDLQEKVLVAVVIAADTIRTDQSPPANQTQRLIWAQSAMESPKSVALAMLWAVLAANKGISVGNIKTASDAAIQSNVDEAVDLFAGS